MTLNKRTTLMIVALAFVAAACFPGEQVAFTSTSTTTTTTTTLAPVATTSTVLESGRSLEVVGCATAPTELEIVCESYDLIKRHYVDDIDDKILAEAASSGLEDLDGTNSTADIVCVIPSDSFVESCNIAAEQAASSSEAAEAMVAGLANYALDANSLYLDRDSLALVEEEQEGEIEGIGALVTAEDVSSGEVVQCSIISETCRLTIVSVISGSPAEGAGMLADDVIVGVNGEDITDWTLDEVTATVRGPSGTNVDLTILRGDETFIMPITRAAIVIPVIESERVGNTGYIRLNIFTENADEQFEEAVDELVDQGIDSLVVDLRNNPGGLLDTAVAITSQFLADGVVVVTQSPDSETSYEVSGKTSVPENIRVVFVVNRDSASASEVVSAVLQERGRITVVGENTFGKNTVQQRFHLSSGGALKLTVARWVTPGGLDFGEVGLTPDFEEEIDLGAPVEAVVETALSAS